MRSRGGAAVILLAVAGTAAVPAPPALTLAVTSQTTAYLAPCGCGGQMAGGLPRRAQLVADARRQHPNLLYLDLGGQGSQMDTLPTTFRTLGYLGAAACGLGPDDLAGLDVLAPLARQYAVPLTSLTPPLSGLAPVRAMVMASQQGPKLGYVSVAFGPLTVSDLAVQAQLEVARLRQEGCAVWLLGSHLGRAGTARLVARLPDADRPRVVLLTTDDNEPAAPDEQFGATWVPTAHKGRSLSLVTLSPQGAGWNVAVEQQLVDEGPVDPVVQGWVEDYYRRLKATEPPSAQTPASFPRPAACLPCHQAVVAAWRGHAHARAVETLEHAGRDVAACLRCHDERLRREGVRSGPGERGVECASCHEGLSRHLAGPTSPGKPDVARCQTCHTPEHSPRWAAGRYLPAVAAVCRAGRTG